MKNKGFTLIELLAVIIILGILLLIAVVSVTAYIDGSRKNAYVTTAKEIIDGATKLVNSGDLEMYDQDTTYYIPSTCVDIEGTSNTDTPYGKMEEAYVGVTYNGDGYDYYWLSRDDAGMGFDKLTKEETLNADSLKSNVNSLSTEYGIGNDQSVVVYNSDCSCAGDPTPAKHLESSGENGGGTTNNNVTHTNLKTGEEINVIMKNLANNSTTFTSGNKDTSVIYFKLSDTEPTDENKEAKNVISIDNEEKPVYVWFDSTDGTMYWWSLDQNPKLNEDSYALFFSFEALVTIYNFENFDSSGVIDMGNMFGNCKKLTSLNLSNFSTDSAMNMYWMFKDCMNLTSLDVTGFNTSKVENMNCMFKGCSKLESLNVSGFDTHLVEDMTGMFQSCKKLTTIDVSGFDTTNLYLIDSMFNACEKLSTIDLSNFDLSNIDSFKSVFYNCKALNNPNLNVKACGKIDNISNLFYYNTSLTSVDLSHLDLSEVTNISKAFNNCSKLVTIYVSSTYSNENITSASSAFSSCSKLKGGNGTAYTSTMASNSTYARVDKEGEEGLFTLAS